MAEKSKEKLSFIEDARRKQIIESAIETIAAQGYQRATLDLIRNGFFSRGDGELFRPLVENLLHHDPYMLCADFSSYLDAQTAVDVAYQDREHWTRMSILNTARSGKFSSDRSIQEYCDDIWRVRPVPIRRDSGVEPTTICLG